MSDDDSTDGGEGGKIRVVLDNGRERHNVNRVRKMKWVSDLAVDGYLRRSR